MPKLPKGLYRRPNGSYYMRTTVHGRDVRRSLGRDRDEAIRRHAQARASGRALVAPRTRVWQAAHAWLATRIRSGRNERGQKLAASRVHKYLVPHLGEVAVASVDTAALRAYRVAVEAHVRAQREGRVARRGRVWSGRDAHAVVSTTHHVVADAIALLRWCEEAGLVERAPTVRRVLPKLAEQVPDRLTDDEVTRVLAIPEPQAFVVRLLLATGVRWGEACRAQASDVDALGQLVVGQTKSGKVRRVPLPSAVRAEVRVRVGRLVPYAVHSPGSFAMVVRRHSGVARFHVHQLRHTFACRWLERGGSLAALQQVLGHASIVTTQRYARISDDLVRREAERVARAG